MSKFIEYITKHNDRWDTIANEFYGNPKGYEPIISANPAIKITPVLQEGIKLYIPVEGAQENKSEELVPWKK